jgi:F-type H+-transporting ATPase subunit b
MASQLALTVALCALPAVAFASSSEGHHGGAPTAGQWLLLLFTFINFVAFAYLFLRFTRTPLREFLRGRRKELVELMATAERAKAEAEALRREYETKLAALDQAKSALVAEVRAIAEADHKRLIAGAKEASERLMRDAERAGQSDIERAKRELRAEAARLAAELAAADVTKRIDDPTRSRLLDEFLAGVTRR